MARRGTRAGRTDRETAEQRRLDRRRIRKSARLRMVALMRRPEEAWERALLPEHVGTQGWTSW